MFSLVFKKGLGMVKMPRKSAGKAEGRTGLLDAGRSPRTGQRTLQGPRLPWAGRLVRMNEWMDE